MRKLYIILFIFFFSETALFSQSASVVFHDTTFVYFYDWDTGDSICYEQHAYVKDSAEQLISSVGLYFDEDENQFRYSYKVENAYDVWGNKILWIQYQWDTLQMQWVGTDKNEFRYNQAGHKLMEAVYRWDTISNEWEGTRKYEYVDTLGNVNIIRQYEWDEKHNEWYGGKKWHYEYDDNGLLSVRIREDWNDNQNVWEEAAVLKFGYDENGNNTEMMYYKNENGNWVQWKKINRKYDEDGNEIQYVTSIWDENTSQWKYYRKEEFDYDEYNNKTLDVYYHWAGYWRGESKKEYKYDEKGNRIFSRFSGWDYVNNDWKYNEETYKEYDENSLLTIEQLYLWDEDKNAWIGFWEKEYTWSPEGWLLTDNKSVWDTTLNDWRDSYRLENAFNACGKKVLESRYQWNTSLNKLYLSQRMEYSYEGYLFTEAASVCPGDSLLWQGDYLKEAGTHTREYHSATCRDSIYRFILSYYDKPASFQITGKTTVANYEEDIYSVPSNDQVSYTWTVAGGNILSHPSENSLKVQWGEFGIGTVYSIASNQYGCRSDTAKLEVDILATAIEEETDNTISVYPNPVGNHLFVHGVEGTVYLEIKDLSGKNVMTEEKGEIDVSGLTPGVYILRIKNKEKKLLRTFRIIKR